MDNWEKQMEVFSLVELERVYEFMTANNWEDLFDARLDDWIIKRMRRHGCLTREGVRNTFNDKAARAGIPRRF